MSEQMDIDIVDQNNQLKDGLPADSKQTKELQEQMAKIK